jgi:hypothetical protein
VDGAIDRSRDRNHEGTSEADNLRMAVNTRIILSRKTPRRL